MPEIIGHEDLIRLVEAEDALLMEVLPRREYEDEHLPGAVSYPIKQLNRDAVEGLDRHRPVIVYCNDYQ